MKSLFITLLVLCTFNIISQNNKNTFDFWVGNWNAYWNDSLKGTNTITKTLKDKVVEENFKINDKSFFGRSWTVYDSTNKIWQQTWVDDAGAYLVFTGGREGDKVILKMAPKKDNTGKIKISRMVFFNIKPDSFDWDWQSSYDQKFWTSNWLIHYKRIK